MPQSNLDLVYRRVITDVQNGLAQTLCFLLAPLPVLAAFLTGLPVVPFALGSGALVVAFCVSAVLLGRFKVYVTAASLVGFCILFTAAFTGHAWQLDSHMLFFASVAIIATQSNIATLVMAAAMIAGHHLVLSIVMPSLVYPGFETIAAVERTVFHGLIVILETATLILAVLHRQKLSQQVESEKSKALEAAMTSQKAQAEADKAAQQLIIGVSSLRSGLAKLAKDNLDCKIEDELSAEFQDLGNDFNYVVDRLKAVLEKTTDAAGDLHSNSSELEQATHSLTNVSAQNDTKIKQSTHTVEHLVASAQTTVEDAQTAVEKAKSAQNTAQQGGDVVTQAIEAMQKIERSSSEISKIITVIEDIAFQTNMLALNAAVEAARAGESGRGFSVVASEVRILAQNTATAASNVNSLIKSSTVHVSEGVKLVAETGQSLSGIVDASSDARALIEKIYAQTSMQAQDLTQMNCAVGDVNRINAKGMEDLSVVTQMVPDLAATAFELRELINRFNLPQQASDSNHFDEETHAVVSEGEPPEILLRA
ncbi:methyl-accepting chemotaxis protein [Algirhabdus cladophorae]|uniref:methyl-accepting chemotaxis protein n=1 Tax=Algirhabdus cladophorae TaxID=3377108 RepID=UPI003B846FE7